MSYIREIGDTTVHVVCASDPETTHAKYCEDIKQRIIADGYEPKTSMDNLIGMVVLSFDCDDNYGEYEPDTGLGGYGDEFTLGECFAYVDDCNGWQEFDFWA